MSQEFLNFMMIVNVLAGQSAVQNGRSGVLTSIWETVENRQVIRRRFPGWRGSDGSDFGLQGVFAGDVQMKHPKQTAPWRMRKHGCLHATVTMTCFALLLFFGPRLVRAEADAPNDVKLNTPGRSIDSRKSAKSLLRKLTEAPVPTIRFLSLRYDVHMDVGWSVQVKIDATLEMRNDKGGYIATFSLSEPVGEDLWSRFALSIFGQHTSQYKEMMRSVETRLEEKFHLKEGRFLTQELKEILPAVKQYENQSGIRVRFDYVENSIQFWEDQTKTEFDQTLKYTGQVGPMTGFFNFIFFEKPHTDLKITNALKRVEEVETSGGFASREKKVSVVFSSELVKLHPNNTGRHMAYPNAVSFETDNFLDIIHGRNIYFELLHDSTHNLKIPYAVQLDGIISKTKRRKKEHRIKHLTRMNPGSRAYEEELEAIQEMDELAAKDVIVLLRGATLRHE